MPAEDEGKARPESLTDEVEAAPPAPDVRERHESATNESPVEAGRANSSDVAPIALLPRGTEPAPLRFRQGAHAPFGVRWYGITSLYGHFRKFIARAIAAEAVDSRDWMRAAEPATTLRHALRVLGGREDAPSLIEGIARPLYIDFVADTGDDRDVSLAVGRMIAATYTVPGEGGAPRVLPRGDILLMGGDIAYPVATADEIYRRLIEPWNIALRAVRHRGPTVKRLLIGVPGNHDWYDGLDGFGRLFRRSVDVPTRENETSKKNALLAGIAKLGTPLIKKAAESRSVGLALRQLHVDEALGFLKIFASVGRSAGAFLAGGGKKRRRRLQLFGYTPIQEASYFAMPLAPGLDLWGVDRQLGRMDFRQRHFFRAERTRRPGLGLLYIASDPATAYGERNAAGADSLVACRLSFREDSLLYLTGDFHHYERRHLGRSTHVIAGGGGAFLHGTRLGKHPHGEPDAEYPTKAMSRVLAWSVPVKSMVGRAGYLVHFAAALLGILEIEAWRHGIVARIVTTTVVSAVVTTILYSIGGKKGARTLSLALPFGVLIGVLPAPLANYLPSLLPNIAGTTAAVIIFSLLTAFAYGAFLLAASYAGLEHEQAFTILGHPGFRHFVRLCVHPDGRIEAFTIGKDDALSDTPPRLIDQFEWKAHVPDAPDEGPPPSDQPAT